MNSSQRSQRDAAQVLDLSDSGAGDGGGSRSHKFRSKGKEKNILKDQVANTAEEHWPSVLQVVYDNGLKVRQQNSVIKTIIAQVIQCCEYRMITQDAFPEMGQRGEFRDKMVKLAIKILCKKVVPNENFIAAYCRAKIDEDFVQVIGEVVSVPKPL